MAKSKSRYARLLGTLWRCTKDAKTSAAAIGVWARCCSYAADNATDGLVPAEVVEGMCKREGRLWRRLLTELTTPIDHHPCKEPTPWLTRTQHGYDIHDYRNENVSASTYDTQRERDRERKRTQRSEGNHALSPDVPPGQRRDAARDSGRDTARDRGGTSGGTSGGTLDTRHKTQDTREDREGVAEAGKHGARGQPDHGLDPPPEPDHDPTTAGLIDRGYSRRFASRYASAPGKSSAYRKALVTLAESLDATASLRGEPVAQLVDRCLDGLFASSDPKVVEARHWLGFPAQDPGEYLDAGGSSGSSPGHIEWRPDP